MARSRSHSPGSALQPHWRWGSVATFAACSVVMSLLALLWVDQFGGRLDELLARGLVLAGYAATVQFCYDVIWWRWQRWRLLVVAHMLECAGFLLVMGLLTSSTMSTLYGRWWIELPVLGGLAGGLLLTVTWWLRNARLRAEGWRW
jgi:hypothetical protein